MKSNLIVEDSRFLRMATEQTLVRAGYSVLTANDGEAALRVAQARIPDLILLDMLLPKLGGPEVLQALKKSALTARIPVIVLSSLSQTNETKLKRVGATAYFEKSRLELDQNSESLLNMVKTALDDLPASDSEVVPASASEEPAQMRAEGQTSTGDEMRRHKGFSLIELLIVVAIILIIAAIVIPNLLRSRIAANESSAAASERTLTAAETSYTTSYPDIGYPASLGILGPATAAGCATGPASTHTCIIDFTLGTKSGYSFAAAGANPINGANTQYVTTAIPTSLNTTGVKAFCAVEDNVVRYITPSGGAATRAVCQGGTYLSVGQ